MTTTEWPWSHLAEHAFVIDRLRDAVDDDGHLRWFEVCCSLAAGRGDALSDIDAGIGYGEDLDVGDLDGVGLAVVQRCGAVVDVLAHVMDGWPPETRRFAALFGNGVQLDLVLLPAGRRTGLPTGSVAVVDKDGRLATPWHPPVEAAPSPAVAREWLMLGWWALSDVAKYLRRNSLFEAVERLTEARQQALRLYAAKHGTPFPSFGLVSLLDFPPFDLPDELTATYARPDEVASVHAAAAAVADLLEASAAPITTPWAETTLARLAAVIRDPTFDE